MSHPFQASYDSGEAVLRFPYHDGLRRLLRAIPGRRWDPIGKVWRVPLDAERAEALTRLIEGLPGEPGVSEDLARRMRRLRGCRDPRECVLDVARPDESWWLSFATDHGSEIVETLLEHDGARALPALGRALLPLDIETAERISAIVRAGAPLRITEDAEHALTEVTRREAERQEPQRGSGRDVELRQDRRGQRWIVIAPKHAPLARALAGKAALRAQETSSGSVAIAAVESDAFAIADLIDHLDAGQVDERLREWLRRSQEWRGTIDVGGVPEDPVFLLLGDVSRLPPELRESASSVDGGASVPLTIEMWRLIEGAVQGWLSAAAKRCIAALKEGRPVPGSVLMLSHVHEHPAFVLAPGHDAGQLQAFASLPGALPPDERKARFDEQHSLPALHADPFCVPALDAFLAEHESWVDPEALLLLQEIRERHAKAAGLVELSAAQEATLHAPTLNGSLKPFQCAGVQYLLSQRRAFLADEQGLGKTVQALATIEADGAYPAIVLCPASLKLNWAREAQRWLPDREVTILSGTGSGAPEGAAAPSADILIVNYDIVSARLQQLSALQPQALVLDESHYCKNGGAKRTQAAHRLASAVPTDGLVLALTGTPVMNRPAELTSQLRILGRLQDFGSGAELSRRFRGSDAHLRLHWHLRARCFVRRLKADVLPQLPPKTRSIVPVELSNEPEYRLAERDVIAWLRTQPLDLRELDAKVAAALRAERLVRLNALKLLAAEGKLHGALAWIHDFLSSGERLVVFARHRKIQHAVMQRFPTALHIVGSDSHAARDVAVRAFQEPDRPDNQLIVCSIELAGQGLTLTQASNVVFLELDWTPAKHDQAEDRCHRIGQQDAVNATYLLACETVDETIAMLLERKRAVIGAVTDGREEDEDGVLDALVKELQGAPYRHLRAVA